MKYNEKRLRFIELYLVRWIVLIQFFVLIGFQVYGSIRNKNSYIEPFIIAVKETLKDNESILVTISAIFIGIYFTVFSLLGSISSNSTFSIVTKDNFQRFIKFIRHAFIGSFLYLFCSILISIIEKYVSDVNDYLTIILFVLMTYMLFSALRLAVVVYLIYQADLSKIHDIIELEKKDKAESKLLMDRLDKYLLPLENDQDLQRAQKMNNFIAAKSDPEKKK